MHPISPMVAAETGLIEGLQAVFWLPAASLYLGYAVVLGLLLRRAAPPGARALDRALAAAHAVLLVLPSSVLVLAWPAAPLVMRLGLLAAGSAAAWLALAQPDWLPDALCRRALARRYLAAAMGLAALWSLGWAASSPAGWGGALLGGAATLAGIASLNSAS